MVVVAKVLVVVCVTDDVMVLIRVVYAVLVAVNDSVVENVFVLCGNVAVDVCVIVVFLVVVETGGVIVNVGVTT